MSISSNSDTYSLPAMSLAFLKYFFVFYERPLMAVVIDIKQLTILLLRNVGIFLIQGKLYLS